MLNGDSRPGYTNLTGQYIIVNDEARGLRFAQDMDVGMTHINDMTVHVYPHVMSNSEKNSGLGRLYGEWIIEGFTTDQFISFHR